MPDMQLDDLFKRVSPGSGGPARCGRPTKGGTPCNQYPVMVGRGGCRYHLTAEERAEYARFRAEVDATQSSQVEEPPKRSVHEASDVTKALGRLPAFLLWNPEIPPPEPDPYLALYTQGAALEELQNAFDVDDPRLQLARWQDERCALCGKRQGLVEDHDHATGLTRGYLCTSCNAREGFAGHIQPFALYRAFPPTALLGLTIRYRHPITGELDYGTGPGRDDPWVNPSVGLF